MEVATDTQLHTQPGGFDTAVLRDITLPATYTAVHLPTSFMYNLLLSPTVRTAQQFEYETMDSDIQSSSPDDCNFFSSENMWGGLGVVQHKQPMGQVNLRVSAYRPYICSRI